MQALRRALATVFSRPKYAAIAAIGAFGLAALYLLLATAVASPAMIVQMSGWADTLARLALTLLVAALFGVNAAFLAYKRDLKTGAGATLGSVAGAFAAGCPACGALLLSLLGVTSGLAAFPLKGFEIQITSAAVLGGVMLYAARGIAGKGCGRCSA
jgi:hypothetical protein